MGKPIFIQDFDLNGEHFYNALHKGKEVKLPFKDLKTVRFLNPGKKYDVEVLFKDGKKGIYSLRPGGNLTIRTKQSIVSMSHTKIAKIEFGTSPPPKSPSQAPVIFGQDDRIFLENGDILSGRVQTKMLKLVTSYGIFDLETSQLSYINFGGRSKDVDVVGLKNGDVFSGKVEVQPVKLVIRGGKEVTLDSGKMKRITFKR
jgi:hypothetical protein